MPRGSFNVSLNVFSNGSFNVSLRTWMSVKRHVNLRMSVKRHVNLRMSVKRHVNLWISVERHANLRMSVKRHVNLRLYANWHVSSMSVKRHWKSHGTWMSLYTLKNCIQTRIVKSNRLQQSGHSDRNSLYVGSLYVGLSQYKMDPPRNELNAKQRNFCQAQNQREVIQKISWLWDAMFWPSQIELSLHGRIRQGRPSLCESQLVTTVSRCVMLQRAAAHYSLLLQCATI